jgi:anti-anti-sigma factor
MNISHHPGADALELRLTGRLDATWADHVSESIEAAVRAGSHRIVLNLAGVNYISSLGLGVLMKHYKRLTAVNGSLRVSDPSATILRVLDAAGLSAYLVADQAVAPLAAAAHVLERAEAMYHAYPQAVAVPLACAAIGDPRKLEAGGFDATDVRRLSFASGTFGLGLGAFGEGFDDCRGRFGEFLAAGGAAITLPTNDAHARPDYVAEEGALVPHVEALYALAGAGDFPWMVRFDAAPGGPGTLPLSTLLHAALDLAGGDLAAFVILAESAGLVGASLRRSPAAGPVSLDFPSVRDWVSFTTERTAERGLVLVVGVAARHAAHDAAAFLRPMDEGAALHAHAHAALFPYRPVQRGELRFDGAIPALLAASPPLAVLHLMADTRPFEGIGETDLVRGACWVGALPAIALG